MFYAKCKRHTGGWCGPGQGLTPSVVCQLTSLARSADGPPDRARSCFRIGPRVPALPISHFPGKRVSRSTPPMHPGRIRIAFSNAPPFSSSPLYSQILT